MSEDKSPIEQVVDLALFAPLGLVLAAKESLPAWVDKGRHRVDVAKMVGEHATRHGQKVVTKTLVGLGILPGPPPPPTRGRAAPREVEVVDSSHPSAAAPPSANGRPAPEVGDAEPADQRRGPGGPDLAIPGYDSLSAFQVVQRLAGLAADELEAVRSYESAGRGRRTILTKISQLQTARS